MTETLSGSKRLDWLKRQMENALSDVETITSRAADEDRNLTDSEQATCEARRSRIEELEPQIQVEADLAQRSATYQDMVAGIGTAPAGEQRLQTVERSSQGETVYDSPGAYLVDFLTRSENPEAKARFERYLQRAVQHQTTAQNPGLLPVPILGPVFSEQQGRRPAIEAATLRPLPGSGKTFQRPKINQYTVVGPQSAEKAELPSRPMLIDPITVTKATYGGAVNLSWQDRDWTDPAIMNLLVADLAASYANATDAAFCTYFVGSVSQTQPVTVPAKGEDILAALYAAVAQVSAGTNTLPDTLWMAPDVWGALGSMTDSTGRQLFPTVNPVNSLGNLTPTSFSGTVAGFKAVMDRNLPAGTAILGDSRFVEVYETVGGQVSAIEPSVLGTTVAFYGYIAWLTLEPDAFVKITGLPAPLNGGGTSQTQTTHKAAASQPTQAAAKKAGSQ